MVSQRETIKGFAVQIFESTKKSMQGKEKKRLIVSDCFLLFPFGKQKGNKRRLEQYAPFVCA